MRNKLPFVLVAIVLLSFVYASIGSLRFATVDDDWMLLSEKLMLVKVFNWNFILDVFTRINSLQYSPLNTFYYYALYQINGFDPYYYHLGSFVIHAFNVVLTYIAIKQILKIFNISNQVLLAYGIALVWAVLPFNVEAVIWISASKILLYTFFGLLSFILFVKAFLTQNIKIYYLSLIAFILSFLAKEQAVLFPLMMALFVFCYTRKQGLKLRTGNNYRYLLPMFLFAFLFGLVTLYTVVYGEGSHPVDRYPFTQRIILSGYCLCFYIFNTFVPVHLHYHYPFPLKLGESLPFIYYLYPVFLMAVVWQFISIVRNKANFQLYIFGFGVFIVHLLLCIQIVPLARAAMLADRYMYIPSIGLLLIIAVSLNEKIDLSPKTVSKQTVLTSAAYIFYCLLLTLYSAHLADNWHTMQL